MSDHHTATPEPHAGMSPAERIAEVPAPTHPVITDRLAEALDTTANLIANSLVSVIADDAVFAAGQRLMDVLGSMLASAERQRDLFGTPTVQS